MNKKMKLGLVISGVVLAVLGILALSYYVLQVPLFDGSGWSVSDTGKKVYLDYFGDPRSGWVESDGQWYYFDEKTCEMQSGWIEIEEETYYLASDGAAASGWTEIEEDRYYFDPGTYAMQTGWIEVDGNRYYTKSSGVMATGWMKSGDSDYYLSPEDGAMQTGWLETEKGKYFLDEEGRRQVSWTEIDGKRYFFNVDGRMRTGWLRTGNGTFYLTETGAAYTGWMTTEKNRFYMLEDGKMATGFVTVDGIERYFLKTGDYIPLVNRENKVPADYEPVLVEVEGYLVDQTIRDALVEMMEGARAAGRTIEISSAFRDEKKQVEVWEEYRTDYMAQGYTYEEAEELTAKYVAEPGTSEHHLGLALDFYNRGDIYEWLAENSWRYGFILRYIKDDGVTAYEPWHFRYVGKEMAKDVYESRLILEKYLETLK